MPSSLAQAGTYTRQQHSAAEGLGKIIDRASLEAADNIFFQALTTHEDHRRDWRAHADQHPAIAATDIRIEHDQIGALLGDQHLGMLYAGGAYYCITSFAKKGREALKQHDIIID